MTLEKDIKSAVQHLTKLNLEYTIIYFFILGVISFYIPRLIPLIIAAMLVRPLGFLIHYIPLKVFEPSDYENKSPILKKITDYRLFSLVVLSLIVPFVSLYMGEFYLWSELGSFAHHIGIFALIPIIWLYGLYERNWYFDRWHLIERSLLIVFGVLTFISPIFVFVFLVIYKIQWAQFQTTLPIGSRGNRTKLPSMALLIIGALSLTSLVFSIGPEISIFLLLCGCVSNYFHSGISKLRKFGFYYYIFKNNPLFMGMNATQLGWMSFIDEEIVLKIGKIADQYSYILSITVVAIQIGTLFIFFSRSIALIFIGLAIFLHLLILFTAGVNFWPWIIMNVGIFTGLILYSVETSALFTDMIWFLLSLLFIIGATAWAKPKQLSWLDSPYFERIEIKAEMKNGNEITAHPNAFRPYCEDLARKVTGGFGNVSSIPRLVRTTGGTNNKHLHTEFSGTLFEPSLPCVKFNHLYQEYGSSKVYDESELQSLEEFFSRFIEKPPSKQRLRWISAPRSYYQSGFSDKETYEQRKEIERIHIYRVNGLWTQDGFVETHRTKIATVCQRKYSNID